MLVTQILNLYFGKKVWLSASTILMSYLILFVQNTTDVIGSESSISSISQYERIGSFGLLIIAVIWLTRQMNQDRKQLTEQMKEQQTKHDQVIAQKDAKYDQLLERVLQFKIPNNEKV